MKKLLLFLLLGFYANIHMAEQNSLVIAKQRAVELSRLSHDVGLERCKTEARIACVLKQAESTRLLIQDLGFCMADKKKNVAMNFDIKKITKNFIPAIMRDSRAEDRIERDLNRIIKRRDKDNADLWDLEENSDNNKVALRVAKSSLDGINETKKLHRELMDIQSRMIALRAQLFNIESMYMAKGNRIRVEAAVPELQVDDESSEWNIADEVANMLGVITDNQPNDADQAASLDQLRNEFAALKEQRLLAESLEALLEPEDDIEDAAETQPSLDSGLVASTDVPLAIAAKKPSFDKRALVSLDEQIKQLTVSVAQLSDNIDSQLKDLEDMTKTFADKTLGQIHF